VYVAYWDGNDLLSRAGNRFDAPKWFTDALPTPQEGLTLDGELFTGRGDFNTTVSIVRSENDPRWKDVAYLLFDAPSLGKQPFEDRLALLTGKYGAGNISSAPQGSGKFVRSGSLKRTRSGNLLGDHVRVVEHVQISDNMAIEKALQEMDLRGGEGLMLRQPGSVYKSGRQSSLLKVKSFLDFEAEVIEILGGDGKHTGLMGALKCRLPPSKKAKTFKVGTGFSDAQRRDPPDVGDIVTIKCPELTPGGIPRFPVFIGVRTDMTKAQFIEQK